MSACGGTEGAVGIWAGTWSASIGRAVGGLIDGIGSKAATRIAHMRLGTKVARRGLMFSISVISTAGGVRFVPGPCHHRRANAALPRRKVALGSSPKAERYWALNRPRWEKPCCSATAVTLASLAECRSSSRTSCNRTRLRNAVGVVSRHWRNPACSERRLMPR
jgi:hypothetical protein